MADRNASKAQAAGPSTSANEQTIRPTAAIIATSPNVSAPESKGTEPAPGPASIAPAPAGSATKLEAAPASSRAEERIQALAREASGRCAFSSTYIARLRRREQVGGRDKPEETLLFKFRREPFSVYFKWLGNEGKGREVVYVRGRYDDKIHTLLAAGDIPLMPAGKRMALSPDNPLVRAASRHPITSAGICYLVGQFNQLAQGNGNLRYIGQTSRPEFTTALEAVEQTIRPGHDAELPQGGKRLWLFDPDNHLPVLVSTLDASGHEVEYYCYDRIQFGIKLDDADFDPDQLWQPGETRAHQRNRAD